MNKKLFLLFLVFFSLQALAETVKLTVNGLNQKTGQLGIAIFDHSNSFPDDTEGAIFTKFYPLATPLNSTVIQLDLAPGKYAIASFLDQNLNQKLDKNLLGIPKERFGFSNNPRILVSAPSFYDCEIEIIKGQKNHFVINLMKLM